MVAILNVLLVGFCTQLASEFAAAVADEGICFTQCFSWVRWLCICIYTLTVNDMLQSSRVKTSTVIMCIQ